MEQFNHISPVDNPENGYVHRLDLIIDNEKIGEAEVEYFSKPFPIYQISFMNIKYDRQGQGFGSKFMEYIEDFLDKKGKAGVLVDAIDTDSPASGMYKRRGWIEVPNSGGLFAYNLPKKATIEQLIGYSHRQTDYSIRKERKNDDVKK